MSTLLEHSNSTLVIESKPSYIVQNEQTGNILVSSKVTDIIIVASTSGTVLTSSKQLDTIIQSGIPGPQGPAGQSEEDMQYAKRLDSVSSTEMYKGEAAVGSLTTSALWRIQKIIFGNDGDVTITWADGNANFDNIWDNRLSLSYS